MSILNRCTLVVSYCLFVPIGGFLFLWVVGLLAGTLLALLAEMRPVVGAYQCAVLFLLWGQFAFAIVSGICFGVFVSGLWETEKWQMRNVLPVIAVASAIVYYPFALQLWYVSAEVSPSWRERLLLEMAIKENTFGFNPWFLLAGGAGLHFVTAFLASWKSRVLV